MTEGRGDRLGRIVLPGLCLESDDAPALLDDRRLGIAVQRAARAQVVDRQADRLGQRQGAELARITLTIAVVSRKAPVMPPWMAGRIGLPMIFGENCMTSAPSSPTRMPKQRAE